MLDIYGGLKILDETTGLKNLIEPIKNNKGCINYYPERSGADDLAENVGKKVSEGSLKSPYNIGKTYKGVGTVVDSSPLTNINGIYNGNIKDPHHFIHRVVERGVSPEIIMDTFRNPEVILSQWNGERFTYITQNASITVTKSGDIVTGWLKSDFGNVTKQILLEAH